MWPQTVDGVVHHVLGWDEGHHQEEGTVGAAHVAALPRLLPVQQCKGLSRKQFLLRQRFQPQRELTQSRGVLHAPFQLAVISSLVQSSAGGARSEPGALVNCSGKSNLQWRRQVQVTVGRGDNEFSPVSIYSHRVYLLTPCVSCLRSPPTRIVTSPTSSISVTSITSSGTPSIDFKGRRQKWGSVWISS